MKALAIFYIRCCTLYFFYSRNTFDLYCFTPFSIAYNVSAMCSLGIKSTALSNLTNDN